MNSPLPKPEAAAPRALPPDFSDLLPQAQEHFKLCWFGAVLSVIEFAHRTFGPDATRTGFPFLADYESQLLRRGVDTSVPGAAERYRATVEGWEARVTAHLPLRALRLQAELGWHAVGALVAAGLHDEDPRFGAIFAELQGGAPVPTVGLLSACFSDGQRGPVQELQDWGLLNVSAGAAARHAWTVQVPSWVWDAISSTRAVVRGPGFTFGPVEYDGELVGELWSSDVNTALENLPELLRTGTVGAVVVRGPLGSGRKSVARRLAAALGRGTLTFSSRVTAGDARWRLLAPLTTLLHALPIVEGELAPGETLDVPPLEGLQAPLVLVLGRRGGVSGLVRPVTLSLDVPSWEGRRLCWRHLVPEADETLHATLATRHRMPIGRLKALCELSRAAAALRGRASPHPADFEERARALHTAAMGSFATPLAEGASWEELALSADALNELRAVESRCRHRERLARETHRFAPNAGVRVLLTGPSGTGKTLAVRVLAAALGRDAYRVELAAVVNKYIGETEKNLEQVLSLAEELDIVLLFDEGDALLARRTAVQSSTDRYANLETNFLLQRLESFEGIVFITTNAAERVDGAFQRRMDAVVELRPPDIDERRRLWELHLPDEHDVDRALLERLAAQCPLTGGQIRNATVHARLLALDGGGLVNDCRLTASVQREYRKLGTTCPLRVL